MEQKKILEFMSDVILELKTNRQWGTAHIYQGCYKSFSLYLKGVDILFSDLTFALLKDYEIFLRSKQRKWNTVATYMKVLKAVYYRAVDCGVALYVPRLFKNVRTTPCVERKKALSAGTIHDILNQGELLEQQKQSVHQQIRLYFTLMFMLRGISFVDLIYLRKNDLRGNVLCYRRRKTGRQMTVMLTQEAMELIEHLRSKDARSYYLFPLLTQPEGSEKAYGEYQRVLHRFNRQLSVLSKECFQGIPLTTYSARHTWATLAYYCEIHPGIISEAMGHSSIKVTETYLKPFQEERIDHANRQVIDFCRYLQSNGQDENDE